MTDTTSNLTATTVTTPAPVVIPVMAIATLQWMYTQLKNDLPNIQSNINSLNASITQNQAVITAAQAALVVDQALLTNLNTCLTAVAANIAAQGGKLSS